MDRNRSVRTTSTTLALIGALAALALLAAACSSSKHSTSAGTTTTTAKAASGGGAPTEAAVEKGLQVIIQSSDTQKPLTPPAGFLSCTAGKLSSADRAVVAKTTSSDKVAGNVAVRSIRAAKACNGDFVVTVFKNEFSSADNGIPGISDAQANCVATKSVDAIAALDDKAIGSSTDSSVASDAVGKALDSCYPISSFIAAEMRQQDSAITDAQIACVNTKLGPGVSWATVTANSDTFQTDLTSAATACGVAG